jgi:hypothetical protein
VIDPRVSLPEHSSVAFATTISVSYLTKLLRNLASNSSISLDQFYKCIVNHKIYEGSMFKLTYQLRQIKTGG